MTIATAAIPWPDPEPEFITRKEAATLARANTDTIARWQKEGKIGLYGEPGHKRLVRTTELRRYLEGGE